MSEREPGEPFLENAPCRCCGAIKKCRLLSAEYSVMMGQGKEKYEDMIVDCFGLLLMYQQKDEGICLTCVCRLRDAVGFRKQIVECEELFSSARLENAPSGDPTVSTKDDILEEVSSDQNMEPLDLTSNHHHSTAGDEGAADDPDDGIPPAVESIGVPTVSTKDDILEEVSSDQNMEPLDLTSNHHHSTAGDEGAAADSDDGIPPAVESIAGDSDESDCTVVIVTEDAKPAAATADLNQDQRDGTEQTLATENVTIGKNSLRPCRLVLRDAADELLCARCGRWSLTKKERAQHWCSTLKTNSNTAKNRLACDQCDKIFTCVDYLNRHKMRIHIKCEKSLKCTQCEKKFSIKEYLTRHHERIHKKRAKTFNCECGKNFAFIYYLTNHKKRCHGT